MRVEAAETEASRSCKEDAGGFDGLLYPASATWSGFPDGAPGEGLLGDVAAEDLRLDQVIAAIIEGTEEPDRLRALLATPLRTVDDVHFRQEVFRDLEDPILLQGLRAFAEGAGQVRKRFAQSQKMEVRYQGERWLLGAAAQYCEVLEALSETFRASPPQSRGLQAFAAYLARYRSSPELARLERETRACIDALVAVRYCVRLRGSRVDVSPYEGQADYSEEVLATFERFARGAVKDYRLHYRSWPAMNHVGAQILQLVGQIFEPEFAALERWYREHRGFFDEGVRHFERDLQWYLAVLAHLEPLRAAGLPFCRPDVDDVDKASRASSTFDLALAARLVQRGVPVVLNDFRLDHDERIFVVSGPNQGGKTTFARAFGQLHHLASLGCPVPARSARVLLADRVLTHFEREEDLSRGTGKLEHDLLRMGEILATATPRSVVILNEAFSSTSLADQRALGAELMDRLVRLDLVAVYVTFVDELASYGPTVVSMVSTVDPGDPSRRTFEVVRKPADGRAYALALAAKHGLGYDQVRHRLGTAEQETEAR